MDVLCYFCQHVGFEFRFDSDASSNLALLSKLWAAVTQLADVFYCLLPCNRKPPSHDNWKLACPALDQNSVALLLQMLWGFNLILTSPASTCFSYVSSFCHAGSSDDGSNSVDCVSENTTGDYHGENGVFLLILGDWRDLTITNSSHSSEGPVNTRDILVQKWLIK